MTSNRYVRVIWTDCQGDAHGWTPADELDATPCVVTTDGILIEPPPRPDHVTVALSMFGGHGETRQVDSVVHVPVVCVHSVDNLSVTLAYPES
jgi:hypothetical protein